MLARDIRSTGPIQLCVLLQRQPDAWMTVLWRPSPNHVAGKISRVRPEYPETSDALAASFPGVFPDWMREEMAARMEGQPIYQYGGNIITSQLHVGDSVVFLGDSGAPMTVTLGLGCNTGLESARIFCGMLEATLCGGEPVSSVPARFSKARRGDVHAVQRIEHMHAIQRGHVLPRSALERRHALFGVHVCGWLDRVVKKGWPVPSMADIFEVGRPQAQVVKVVNGVRYAAYAAVVVAAATAMCGAAAATRALA